MIDPEELEALAAQIDESLAEENQKTLVGVDMDAMRRRIEAMNDAAEALRRAAHETRKAWGLV